MPGKYVRVVLVATLGVALAQCGPQPMDKAARTGMMPGHLSDTAVPYRYQARIKLSPRAVEKLNAAHEKVIFSTWYFGYPTPASQDKADDMGRISFNSRDITREVSADQTFAIEDKAIDAAGLGYIGGKPYLNINVVSARLSSEYNLLSCSLFEDQISVAMAATIVIECDLIR